MTALTYVRTHYAHWAKRSGYCLLVPAVERLGRLPVEELVTSPDNAAGQTIAEQTWQDCLLPWYTALDQLAEARLAQRLAGRPAGQIVHFLDGEKGYYYSQRLAAQGHKLIATFHQPPRVLAQRELLGDRSQLQALARAVVLTQEQKDHLSRFMDAARIAVLPHGVDTAYFRPAPERTNGTPRLLSVGFWLRDFRVLAEAAERLDGRPVEYHVVGLRAGMRNHAVDRRLFERIAGAPNVTLHDGISDEELLGLYQSASAMAMPLVDGTANNGLLEAAAAGLAIVSTDLPGARTMFGEDSALLSPPGDGPGFLANIERLLDCPGDLARCGQAARTRMEARFQWDAVAEQYAELYAEVQSDRKIYPGGGRPAMRAICTIITSDYLAQACALEKSAHAHMDADFIALVSDTDFDPATFERVRDELRGRVELLRVQDLQVPLPEYASEDSVRWALKAPLLLHLLERMGYAKVIFLDSDVCVFGSLDFLFEELDSCGMLLTPHWRPTDPHTNPIQFPCNFLHGLYNAGFIGASRAGLAPLEWWRTACAYRCEKTVTQGYYVDQRYLDLLPARFDNVRIVRHKGCNVAEWNRDTALRVHADGATYIENWPVVFVHFSDITLAETTAGLDPCLTPLLRTYRAYFDEADREVAARGWDLRRPAPDLAAANTAEVVDAGAPPAALCAVFDRHRLADLPGLVNSVAAHLSPTPALYLCCADYDTYQLLRARSLPAFCTLLHWSALDAYELEKQHGLYAGDQRRFTRVSQPFFVRHLAATVPGRVLFLDSSAVFTRAPRRLLAELGQAGRAWVLPRLRPETERESMERCGYWLAGIDAADSEFLAFWTSQVLKRREWDKLVVPGVEHDVPVRLADRELPCLAPDSPEVEVLFGDPGRVAAPRGPLADLRPGDGAELEELLGRIPARDVVRAALRQGNDIHNFGRQEGFKREEEASPVHVAYTLYLIGVMYRESGREPEAEAVFTALTSTALCLPDMYRSKALAHLGALRAAQGDPDAAAALLHSALERFPGNREATAWLAQLKT